jgi:16S rRNA (guanine(966)-N(2))-methyltransferase RsmD
MPQGQAREKEIINPNRLRIIAGTAKGKKIDSPDVYLRPMMAKVREALFSTLGHLGLFETGNARVLDMFCGSGSVGLEALSRGAGYTTFVDLSNDCVSTAMSNAVSCGFDGRVSAVCARAEDVLTDPARFNLIEPFGLISITPPYEEVVYSQLLDAVCNSPLVTENTLVVIEYPVEMGTLPHILGQNQLFGIRNRKYGRTVLGIYVYRPSRKYDSKPEEFLSLK